MNEVVGYIPPNAEPYSQYARECVDHSDRRGQYVVGIYRSMDDVRAALKRGASLVVFARQSHWHPDMRVPAEIVGDETRNLAWSIPPKDRLADRRQRINVGARTEDLRTRTADALLRWPRNDRAAQLVEDEARQLGFPPAGDLPPRRNSPRY